VAADHHVDARHGLGQAHVVAIAVAAVLVLLHAAVAERDDHMHLLRLAEDLHHLPGGLDGLGERHGTRAARVVLRLLAEQTDETEADTATVDHEMAADRPGLGKALEIGQRCVGRREVRIRGEHRRSLTGLGGHADRLAQAVGSEVELVVAEGGGVVPHAGHESQLAAGLATGGAERGPHAVVARVEHQHGPLAFARFPPLRDQGGQARVPAPGRVVVDLQRRVVRRRAHSDEGRVHVVGVQDGEGLRSARGRGHVSRQRDRGTDGRCPGQELATRDCFV
jgi:hypothetical protein